MSFHSMIDAFYDHWDRVGDPRLKDWFLMSSPVLSTFHVLLYILFVTKIGPKLMENREPFKLTKVLLVYNLFQVIICTFLFYKGSVLGWMTHYTWFCQPVDYSDAPEAVEGAKLIWVYFLLKHIEFLDTVFFVLRKKNNQITPLHIYHHSIMAFGLWFAIKIRPGGSYTFFGYVNCFVHIIMYGYYLLAAMGPKIQKYLWWKKYLTKLQILQFVLVLLHTIPHFFIEDCYSPPIILIVLILGAIVFIILFANFYRREYTLKAKERNQQRDTVKLKNN